MLLWIPQVWTLALMLWDLCQQMRKCNCKPEHIAKEENEEYSFLKKAPKE